MQGGTGVGEVHNSHNRDSAQQRKPVTTTHEEIESHIEGIKETKTVTMEDVRARYAFVSHFGYYPYGKILFVNFFLV